MDIKAWDLFEKLLLCTIIAKFNVSESKKVDTAWKNPSKTMKMAVSVFHKNMYSALTKINEDKTPYFDYSNETQNIL